MCNETKIEILLSAMNIKSKEENENILKTMNVGDEALTLTINQITNKEINEFQELDNTKNKMISKAETGTSKSRNLAIEKAVGDICLIAEEDVVYEDNYIEIIKKAYSKYQKYDMICFFVESTNPDRKIKRMFTCNIGKLRTMKMRSFEISFNKSTIINKGIKFDESFGPGTKIKHGEETIFLGDCIDKRYKNKIC